jgi:hypothetical protein
MTLNPFTWYRDISEILKIKGLVQNMKLSELQTSEGRLTLILNVIAVYGSIQGFLPAALTAKIAVVSVAAYSIARSLVKAAEAIVKLTPSTKDDAVVAEVGKVLDAVAPKTDQPE